MQHKQEVQKEMGEGPKKLLAAAHMEAERDKIGPWWTNHICGPNYPHMWCAAVSHEWSTVVR